MHIYIRYLKIFFLLLVFLTKLHSRGNCKTSIVGSASVTTVCTPAFTPTSFYSDTYSGQITLSSQGVSLTEDTLAEYTDSGGNFHRIFFGDHPASAGTFSGSLTFAWGGFTIVATGSLVEDPAIFDGDPSVIICGLDANIDWNTGTDQVTFGFGASEQYFVYTQSATGYPTTVYQLVQTAANCVAGSGSGNAVVSGQNVTFNINSSQQLSYDDPNVLFSGSNETVTTSGTFTGTIAPATISITTDKQTYYISAKPEMPVVTATVTGDNLKNASISWTAAIMYDPTTSPNGPARGDLDIPLTSPIVLRASQPFVPNFGGLIRGGNLIITASVVGDDTRSATTQGLTVLGSNSFASKLPATLASEYPQYAGVLQLIASDESATKQFVSGYPLWSADNLGGVGLFQLTNPVPTPDQVWDWTANLDGAESKFDSVAGIATRYRIRIRNSPVYKALVNSYNQKRQDRGLSPLTITLAPFTSGDFNGNYQQTERMAVRAYNGTAGKDPVFHFPLQEYMLATATAPNGEVRLNVKVDEAHLKGTAYWVPVPVADRPQNVGDPNYVEDVLGSPSQ